MSSIRAGVESVFDGLHSASQFLSASRAPLDTYGGRHFPSLLDRSFDEIKNVVEHGPPFTPADLVRVCSLCEFSLRAAYVPSPFRQPAYINAVATLGDNIDDRKLLVRFPSSVHRQLPLMAVWIARKGLDPDGQVGQQ